MIIDQALMHIYENLRAACDARLPKEHADSFHASPSQRLGKGRRPRTKQEQRHALQLLKAIRAVRGQRLDENVQPKKAA